MRKKSNSLIYFIKTTPVPNKEDLIYSVHYLSISGFQLFKYSLVSAACVKTNTCTPINLKIGESQLSVDITNDHLSEGAGSILVALVTGTKYFCFFVIITIQQNSMQKDGENIMITHQLRQRLENHV